MYKKLKDGHSIAESLRIAQLEIMEQFDNPYYWASFI